MNVIYTLMVFPYQSQYGYTIYNATSEQAGREALEEVTEKWEEKSPRAMKRWYDD